HYWIIVLQCDDWTTQQKNELVFIGRNLDKSLIKQQLKDCLVDLVINNEFSLPNLPW
ncbi:MAG TPA: hypothetical protein DCF68_10110, partial [Cyanothece sp. UBA12306]|nr:hypothetical protein [Cyanothece sp. UBA12306]